MIIRVLMMLISTFLIAFGIFMYVPADIMPLAGEGAMLAISEVTKKPFANIKLIFANGYNFISYMLIYNT